VNRESPETKAWWENVERMTREQGTENNEEFGRVLTVLVITIVGGAMCLAAIFAFPSQNKNVEALASFLIISFALATIVALIRGGCILARGWLNSWAKYRLAKLQRG